MSRPLICSYLRNMRRMVFGYPITAMSRDLGDFFKEFSVPARQVLIPDPRQSAFIRGKVLPFAPDLRSSAKSAANGFLIRVVRVNSRLTPCLALS